MKKLLFIPLVILFSCKPCERLAKRCPPVVRDSIITETIIKDDPSFTIPDSLYWRLEFECDSNYEVLLRDFAERNTGLKTEIKFVKYVPDEVNKKIGRLQVNLSVFTDSIMSLNRTIEKLRSERKTITIEVEKKVPVKYVPVIYRWSLGILISLILLAAGWIYLRLKK